MSINLCQSITIQTLTLQQRVQAINLLLDGLDNGMPGVCGPQEGIAKILKTMFRENLPVFGTDIHHPEFVDAILEYSQAILKINLKRHNSKVFQSIIASYIYNVLNRLKTEGVGSFLPNPNSSQVITELIKLIRLCEWMQTLDESRHNQLQEDPEQLHQAYKKYLLESGQYEDREHKSNKVSFVQALTSREGIESELQVLTDTARGGKSTANDGKQTSMASEPTTALIKDITRLRMLLRTTASFRKFEPNGETLDLVAGLSNAIEAAFKAAPQIQNFLIKDFVYQRIKFTISERLTRRFANDIISRGSRGMSEPNAHSVGFLNMIGKFMLVSMGVISQDIYSMRKFEIPPEVKEIVSEFNLEPLLDRLGFQTSGTVYFNRFDVMGRKASPAMDNNIRQFVTQTLRTHKDDIIEHANFQPFIGRIQEHYASLSTKERRDKDLLRESYSSEILQVLSERDFLLYLQELLAKPEVHSKMISLYNL